MVGIVSVDIAVVGIFLAALNGALLELELDTYTRIHNELQIGKHEKRISPDLYSCESKRYSPKQLKPVINYQHYVKYHILPAKICTTTPMLKHKCP